MTPAIKLRAAEEHDEPFLFELYKTVRSREFAQLPLPPRQLDMLMRMQYDAQKRGYESQFPNSQHSIVLADDTRIGRLWVFRSPEEHRLVDIALLPDYQGKGIGNVLVREIIADAKNAGAPLRCSVALTNPGSLRFHQRLGFEIASQDPMYYQLEYRDRGFDQFRRLVWSDPAIAQELQLAPDQRILFDKVLALARERGYDFSEQDLEESARASRRAWFEKWLYQ